MVSDFISMRMTRMCRPTIGSALIDALSECAARCRSSPVPDERYAVEPWQRQDRSCSLWRPMSKGKVDTALASGLSVSGSVVPFGETVKLLGVTFDLIMWYLLLRITEVVRRSNHHIRALGHIRSSLSRCCQDDCLGRRCSSVRW
jgi:hypothetical protein